MQRLTDTQANGCFLSQPPPLEIIQEVNNMDIGALAGSVTTALVPLLPFLLKAGEKAAEETGKTVAGQRWEWAKSLWTKLKPKVEANPAALVAAQEVAQAP